jgi:hypothetical protein
MFDPRQDAFSSLPAAIHGQLEYFQAVSAVPYFHATHNVKAREPGS